MAKSVTYFNVEIIHSIRRITKNYPPRVTLLFVVLVPYLLK